MRRGSTRLAVSLAAIAVTAVLAVLVATGAHIGVRTVFTVVFYFGVPGWAIVAWFAPDDNVLAASLSIGLSVAIGILVAEGMLVFDAWDPDVAFWFLAVAAVLLLGGQVVLAVRRR